MFYVLLMTRLGRVTLGVGRADGEGMLLAWNDSPEKAKRVRSTRLVVPRALTSEAERDSAVDVDLVGILGITHDVTAPERIAPPAGFVRLDVGRRPADADPSADLRLAVYLHAGPPRARKLRAAADRSGHAVHTRIADVAVARAAQTAE